MEELFIKTEYSGTEFNSYHKPKNTKFLYDNLEHNRFKYRLGLNIDTVQFNTANECSSGGLYFCEESKCHLYFNNYGKKVAFIEIPDDARICVEKDKFKADRLTIKKIREFDNMGDNFWVKILPHNFNALQYIKKQNKEICTLAVKQNGFALRYVDKSLDLLTEKLCVLAVKQNCFAICHLKDIPDSLTESNMLDICLLAVNKNGLALRCVNQNLYSELNLLKICIAAVTQNGLALQYVNRNLLTESDLLAICTLAVKQNGLALEYVNNQNSSSLPTKELCILAVNQNNKAFKFVNNPLKWNWFTIATQKNPDKGSIFVILPNINE